MRLIRIRPVPLSLQHSCHTPFGQVYSGRGRFTDHLPSRYRLQGATNLTGAWLTHTSNVLTQMNRLRLTAPLSNSRQFFLIKP